jgi:FAD/FMN-containing dehydrogenase
MDVDMGVYFKDIEHEALKHNLMFAPYTSSKDVCGIGGMLGNNASGEKSIRFGATIDNVLSARVFLSDGKLYNFEEITEEQCLKLSEQKSFIGNIHKEIREIYKNYGKDYTQAIGNVSKSASGYKLDKVFDKEKNTWNLAKIFIGSQSTLGIIHSAKLKLVEVPTHTRLVVIPIKSLISLPVILQKIMQYNPESVETFDINTFVFAKSFLPEDTLKTEKYFSRGEQLIILAQFDNDDTAHKVFLELKDIESNTEYIYDEEIKTSLWKVRRSSFGVMRDHVYDKKTKKAVPCIEDIIVPIDKFDVFIPGEILMFLFSSFF